MDDGGRPTRPPAADDAVIETTSGTEGVGMGESVNLVGLVGDVGATPLPLGDDANADGVMGEEGCLLTGPRAEEVISE